MSRVAAAAGAQRDSPLAPLGRPASFRVTRTPPRAPEKQKGRFLRGAGPWFLPCRALTGESLRLGGGLLLLGGLTTLAFFSLAGFSALGAAALGAASFLAGFSAGAGVFAYFLRNRSMRPCVSISFCLPVKNGWQLLQMSSIAGRRGWTGSPRRRRRRSAPWRWGRPDGGFRALILLSVEPAECSQLSGLRGLPPGERGQLDKRYRPRGKQAAVLTSPLNRTSVRPPPEAPLPLSTAIPACNAERRALEALLEVAPPAAGPGRAEP